MAGTTVGGILFVAEVGSEMVGNAGSIVTGFTAGLAGDAGSIAPGFTIGLAGEEFGAAAESVFSFVTAVDTAAGDAD